MTGNTIEHLDASEMAMLKAQKEVDNKRRMLPKKESDLGAASEQLKAADAARNKTPAKVDKMLNRFNQQVEPFARVKWEGGKLHGSFDQGDGEVRFNIPRTKRKNGSSEIFVANPGRVSG